MGLLEACKQGDSAALERLCASRAAQVYRWAVLFGLRPAEAEDAAQEVLATAVRKIADCQSEAQLTSWLYQIARRVVANTRRLAWFRRLFSGGPSDEDAPAFEHEAFAETERELAVRQVLARLPRAQAEVLVLVEIDGHTRDEVAQMLGIPPGTVASRLRLAREAFKARWEHGATQWVPGGGTEEGR